jgi:hypothetical protein
MFAFRVSLLAGGFAVLGGSFVFSDGGLGLLGGGFCINDLGCSRWLLVSVFRPTRSRLQLQGILSAAVSLLLAVASHSDLPLLLSACIVAEGAF